MPVVKFPSSDQRQVTPATTGLPPLYKVAVTVLSPSPFLKITPLSVANLIMYGFDASKSRSKAA